MWSASLSFKGNEKTNFQEKGNVNPSHTFLGTFTHDPPRYTQLVFHPLRIISVDGGYIMS